jgi:hypothetical protein
MMEDCATWLRDGVKLRLRGDARREGGSRDRRTEYRTCGERRDVRIGGTGERRSSASYWVECVADWAMAAVFQSDKAAR